MRCLFAGSFIAVGECGLDETYDRVSTIEQQTKVLRLKI